MQLVALPSPSYIPGPEHPPTPIEPYAIADLPIALSLSYIADSNPDEDSEDGPVDYPTNEGDDDNESSDNDNDDDDDEDPFEDEDDDEEEEHLAPVDYSVVLVVNLVPSVEDTEALETGQRSRHFFPYLLHKHPHLLYYHHHYHHDEPLFIPPVDRREDTLEAELPPHKRLRLTTPTSRYEVGEGSTTAPRPTGGYRQDYRDVWVDPTKAIEEVAPMTLEGVNTRVTELAKEALASWEAWAYSVGLSSAVHQELQAYRTHTQIQDQRITSHEALTNNMPPKRTSAAARAAAAAPMTAGTIEQLIEARVSAALANHETLRNSTNGQGDGSHYSNTRMTGTMESIFPISNCAVENQVKFATCTFLGNALTWWNSHMKAVTQYVAYAMDWKTLRNMMTDKYCPRGEIKKLEIELWNLKIKWRNMLVDPNVIRGNVMSYQPKTMAKAIEFANDQMDQKVLTITERQAEQNKIERTCAPRCNKCKKIGHLAHDCRSSGPNGNNNKRGNSRTTQTAITCYECGIQGHYKKDCPKLKNGNCDNRGGNDNAPDRFIISSSIKTKKKRNKN
nr:hypothetical protein [Tanacetum cinerariifolium]